ncbi:hypothetical protein HQQ80_09540 [Microbacteriaceae bacterium VKM Ac-2855]|nr:hypothetical protein [Microbacteriaceae bacterium VKM Ac-2855]
MTEKPIFDPERDLAIRRMLAEVSRTEPAPSRRRRASFLIGLIVAALLVSSGGVAIALTGVFPFPVAAPPASVAPTPSPTSTPVPTPTIEPTPIIVAPAPTPTLDPSDPDTWTIDFDGVGPVSFGGSIAETATVLQATPYALSGTSADECPARFFVTDGSVYGEMVLAPDPTAANADVIGTIGLNLNQGSAVTGPRTRAGIGMGSSLAEMLAAYPDIERTGSYGDGVDYFAVSNGAGVYITFAVYTDSSTVHSITVNHQDTPVSEYCG